MCSCQIWNVDEIGEKWTIYRKKIGPKWLLESYFTVEKQYWSLDRNLGEIWSLDHHIGVGVQFWPLDHIQLNLDHQMHMKLIVGARTKSGPSNQCREAGSRWISSRCKVSIFSKNHQYFSFYRNFSNFWWNLRIFLLSTFHPPLSFPRPLKHEISPKFWPKKPKFSSLFITLFLFVITLIPVLMSILNKKQSLDHLVALSSFTTFLTLAKDFSWRESI